MIKETGNKITTSPIKKTDKVGWKKYSLEISLIICAFLLWFAGIYGLFFSPPTGFPAGTIVRIKKGASINQISHGLYNVGFIRSPLMFKIGSKLYGGKLMAGDYNFTKNSSVLTVARRMAKGEFGIEVKKITIQEGLNSNEIAQVLDKNIKVFNIEEFLTLAREKEGQLFPDTYFIKPSDDEKDIIDMMTSNFSQKTAMLAADINKSGKTMNEILTMASMIELEARTMETRKMISGILWLRIAKDMKLQVDAVFPYIMGKYSLQLSMKDLSYDSPYNTYRYKGLPPGPVCNPGINSIIAALEPTKTKYLYYLSDRDGNMHYATTYPAHMANRRKYIGS